MTIDDVLLQSFKKQEASKKGTKLVSSASHHQEDFVKKLMASSKLIPITEIAFVKVDNGGKSELTSRMDSLKSKYINLATDKSSSSSTGCSTSTATNQITKQNGSLSPGLGKDAIKSDGVPVPRVILYPTSRLMKKWSDGGNNTFRNGAGLINSGNTCFLNSVLQSLIYCVPLHHYLLSKQHSKSCQLTGFCMLCELERLAHRLVDNPHGAANPSVIIHNLKNIGKNFRFGRQEDAHEFLRHVIESMQKSCLYGLNPKLDRWSKETTLVHQIYGGYLRSQVTCCQCGYKSNTFETSLDICLDICKVVSLQDALKNFTKVELLTQGNLYDCSKCKRKVQAKKRCTIHRPPLVLTLQLKRYNFHMSWKSSKLKAHLFFPSVLDIRPYLSQSHGPPVKYELYSTVVHAGDDCHCGHYYGYVKSPTGQWIEANDARMNVRNRESVLRNSPYILFYQRVDSTSNISPSPSNISSSPSNTQIHRTEQTSSSQPIQKQENGFQIRRPQSGPSMITADRPKLKFNFNNSTIGSQPKLIGPQPKLIGPMLPSQGSGSTNSVGEKKNGVRTQIVPYGRSGESSSASSSDVDTTLTPSTGNTAYNTNKSHSPMNGGGCKIPTPVPQTQTHTDTSTLPVTVRKRTNSYSSSQNGGIENIADHSRGGSVRTRVTSTSTSWVPSDGGHSAHNICSDSSLHSNTSNTSITSTSGWSVSAQQQRDRHLRETSSVTISNGHTNRPLQTVSNNTQGHATSMNTHADEGSRKCESFNGHVNGTEVRKDDKKDEIPAKDGSGDRSVQQGGPSRKEEDEDETRRVRKKLKKHKKRKKDDRLESGDNNRLKDAARLEASLDHKAGKIKIKIRRSSDSDSEENTKSNTKQRKEEKHQKKTKRPSSEGSGGDPSSTRRDRHDRVKKKSKVDKKKPKHCRSDGLNDSDGNDSVDDLVRDESERKEKDTHNSAAVVKSWDHHVRDSFHKKKRKTIDYDDRHSSCNDHADSRYGKKHKIHSDSDHKIKSNSSMNEIIDHIHSRNYSHQVETWDGSKSQVDCEDDRRRSSNGKRKYDYWDGEIDSGKQKKKRKKSHRNDHHFRYNQFQNFQSSMNSMRPCKR